ncbi:DNA polymerase III subunit delta' [Gardnerella sp. KA01002]|uniref:DNA polymerase III subunit delta' n=1 Tax=Gardnerella sp. KA01002 TaxID=2749082 RepID=UPI003BA934B4
MDVWESVVGQAQVVERLKKVAQGDSSKIAQSWLICGSAGFGCAKVARAFAAALQSSAKVASNRAAENSATQINTQINTDKIASEVLAGTSPDVNILSTDKVTVSIDEVRELVSISEQMPSVAPWRIIIIEDVGRMLERTTNVLLKEIEEPAPRTIWILCAASAADVLPTIRSRSQIVNLAQPSDQDVQEYVQQSAHIDAKTAANVARIAQGNVDLAMLYATSESARSRREELVAGVLRLSSAIDAIMLAQTLIEDAKSQAEDEVQKSVEAEQSEFLRINGIKPTDKIPPKIRSAYNAIGKKDDVKRKVTRVSRDVLNRAIDAICSVYRDVLVVLNNAQLQTPLVNQEFKAEIMQLSKKNTAERALKCLDALAVAKKRLAGNGNATLVFEALLCALS